MSDLVIPAPPTPTLPVEGGGRFPVRRILCVGRNYAAHRAEMGHDDREPPFFFSKPADAVVPPGGEVPYPSATADLHHEIELVLALSGGGAGCSGGGRAVAGVRLRGRRRPDPPRPAGRSEAKGQPWDAAKGFDASAPTGVIRRAAGAWPAGRLRLSVNGDDAAGRRPGRHAVVAGGNRGAGLAPVAARARAT
jgi:fumarylpyruvate hydrolase